MTGNETNVGTREATPFTNEHFIAFLRKMIGQPYWYGTCVYKCTSDLLNRKAKQYPSHYKAARMPTYKKHIAQKKICADCIGVAKGYAWTNAGDGVIDAIGTDTPIVSKYGTHNCPDKGANAMFAYAKDKGMPWGTIATLPEIVGVAVTFSGHVGYYAGGGKVIEFKGFNYGGVETALSAGKWTHWYYLPFLNYADDANAGQNEPHKYSLGSRLLKRGSKGDDVERLQRILIELGYDLGFYGADGDYGSKTENAVKQLQRRTQIQVDGKYGSITHKALMGLLDDREKGGNAEDDSIDDMRPIGKLWVTADRVNVRTGPSTAYKVITVVNVGDVLPYLVAAGSGWYSVEINGKAGWICSKYAALIDA